MKAQRLASLFGFFLCCLQLNSATTSHQPYGQHVVNLDYAFGREKFYLFENSFKLNWFKAAEYCRSQNMFLVSLHDEQELKDAVDYIQRSGYFANHQDLQMWTSGNDLGEQGQLYWGATGARITLNRFAIGEPSNTKYEDGSTEDCIVLESSKGRNFTFDDRPCKREYYFLCENRSD